MGYNTKVRNHPQPSATTHKHPKPPKTIHNYQLSTTIHNHSQPPTTTEKLLKKAKTCQKRLFYCALDVNAENRLWL